MAVTPEAEDAVSLEQQQQQQQQLQKKEEDDDDDDTGDGDQRRRCPDLLGHQDKQHGGGGGGGDAALPASILVPGGRTTRAAVAYDTQSCGDSTLWRSAQRNAHASQAARSEDATNLRVVPVNEFVPLGTELPRVLSADLPRAEYRPRPRGERRTIQHWGQRKLLLSEVEFLTHFGRADFPVVYAGAAPGTHIPYLARLFPHYEFVLVDPNRFDAIERENVHIVRDFFTSEMADQFAHLRTLFISDIRTANPKTMDSSEVEARVKMDNVWQQAWHTALRPRASMLKFRLPYNFEKDPNAGEVYLDGHAWLPVWGRVQTSETRLVSGTNTQQRKWNLTAYEEQCYWFNTVLRPSAFAHNVPAEQEGLDHCYDCAGEVDILRQYLVKHIADWMCDLRPDEQAVLADVPAKVAAIVDDHARACAAAGMALDSVSQDRRPQEVASEGSAGVGPSAAAGTVVGSGGSATPECDEVQDAAARTGDDNGPPATKAPAVPVTITGASSSVVGGQEAEAPAPSSDHHREKLLAAVEKARALNSRPDAGEPVVEIQQQFPTVEAGSTAPPLLRSLWYALDLTNEQRSLIDSRVARMVREMSRECSRGKQPRALGQLVAPTEERGYQFDSNMEARLQPLSREATQHFGGADARPRLSHGASRKRPVSEREERHDSRYSGASEYFRPQKRHQHREYGDRRDPQPRGGLPHGEQPGAYFGGPTAGGRYGSSARYGSSDEFGRDLRDRSDIRDDVHHHAYGTDEFGRDLRDRSDIRDDVHHYAHGTDEFGRDRRGRFDHDNSRGDIGHSPRGASDTSQFADRSRDSFRSRRDTDMDRGDPRNIHRHSHHRTSSRDNDHRGGGRRFDYG